VQLVVEKQKKLSVGIFKAISLKGSFKLLRNSYF